VDNISGRKSHPTDLRSSLKTPRHRSCLPQFKLLECCDYPQSYTRKSRSKDRHPNLNLQLYPMSTLGRTCARFLRAAGPCAQRRALPFRSNASSSRYQDGGWLLRPAIASQTTLRRPYSAAGGGGQAAAPTTGFSYPGPRKLNEIVKLQLLNKHGAPRVREIWKEYHADHKTAVGDVFTAEEYGLFMQRTGRCKHFVLPVPRYVYAGKWRVCFTF